MIITKTPAQKGGIKPGVSVSLLHPIPEVVEAIALPEDVQMVIPSAAQVVILCVRTRADLDANLPAAVAELEPGTTLWVCFRKGARAAGLDMSRNDVWAAAADLGLRPLGLVAVDATRSAFRLRRPSA